MFTGDQIKRLQLLYKKVFGKQITDKETLEHGMKILEIVRLTFKPPCSQTKNKGQCIEKLKLNER